MCISTATYYRRRCRGKTKNHQLGYIILHVERSQTNTKGDVGEKKERCTTTNEDESLYQLTSSMICFLEKLPEAVYKPPTIASVNSQQSLPINDQVLKNSTGRLVQFSKFFIWTKPGLNLILCILHCKIRLVSG